MLPTLRLYKDIGAYKEIMSNTKIKKSRAKKLKYPAIFFNYNIYCGACNSKLNTDNFKHCPVCRAKKSKHPIITRPK